MDKRERRNYYPRRDEWEEERQGVWDEDEELSDKPPLPERLGQRVRRASREIGHEVSDEMERVGERLRSWSQDAGRHAERLTDDLGDGIQRVARTGRRWIGEGDEDADLREDVDDEIDYRRRKKNKKLGKKVAKEMQKQKKRLDELDEQITRPTIRSAGTTKPYVEDVDDVDERNTSARSRGSWGSWFGRKVSNETRGKPLEEAERRLQSDIDLVCVDSSIASEQAFRYALRNVPRGHTLLLVHGIFTPPGAVDSKSEDEREMGRVKDKFRSLCQRNNRRCVFREFEYTTNNELGENVCAIAERQNVGSVILGKRANASDLRRALLGSPSLSVMQQCNAPVTLIAERKEDDWIQ